MSLRRAGSLFDRAVKRAFNDTKYANLTATRSESYSHLGFYSWVDMKMGRMMFTFGFVVSAFILYYEPGYIHETFGHFHGPVSEDYMDLSLDHQERKLNRLILKREEEEHKLHEFMELFKNYED